MQDPGLDRHEWQTEWEALEDELHASPAETLPEVHDLIERMLLAHGYVVNGEDDDNGGAPDVVVAFRTAREVTRRLDHGQDVDPGDIGEAVHSFVEIYDALIDRPEN